MAFDDGRTVVTTAATRVPLSATSLVVDWVTVIALTSNTRQINVGDVGVVALTGSTERGIPLLAGQSTTFTHVDLSKVFIDSRVDGEGVTYVYGAGNAPVSIGGSRRTIDAGGLADTLTGAATTTAPAAGAAVATIVSPPVGVYKIRGQVVLSGTAETLLVNTRVIVNGGAVAVMALNPAGVSVVELPRITVTSGNATISAVANATAGAVYTASISMTRIE